MDVKNIDCRECGEAVVKAWARGLKVRRCFASDAGRWRGRVVGYPTDHMELPVEAPAWCPRRKGELE